MQELPIYKLCGYIDLALIETGFVIPVFKNDDQLYIEIHFNDIITDFVLVPDDYLPLFTDDTSNGGYEASTGYSCCYAFKWFDGIHYGASYDMVKVFTKLLTGKIVPYYTELNMRNFIKKFRNKSSKPISLMIVDDHTLIRETWAYLIERMPNYEVIAETGDGQTAIEMARDKRPDIILLDINMSPLNGFDILKMVRKLSPGSRNIAVTMHSQPAYAKKMFRMGCRGYVTKNSKRPEMFYAINQVYSGNPYLCNETKQILSEQLNDETNADINSLTEREIQVINLISEGLSSKEIAIKLKVSIKTVEIHRHNLLKKLKLKNTASLINFVNSMRTNA
jgi:two-component system, NarL family, invasion response regulator UvrY